MNGTTTTNAVNGNSEVINEIVNRNYSLVDNLVQQFMEKDFRGVSTLNIMITLFVVGKYSFELRCQTEHEILKLQLEDIVKEVAERYQDKGVYKSELMYLLEDNQSLSSYMMKVETCIIDKYRALQPLLYIRDPTYFQIKNNLNEIFNKNNLLRDVADIKERWETFDERFMKKSEEIEELLNSVNPEEFTNFQRNFDKVENILIENTYEKFNKQKEYIDGLFKRNIGLNKSLQSMYDETIDIIFEDELDAQMLLFEQAGVDRIGCYALRDYFKTKKAFIKLNVSFDNIEVLLSKIQQNK